MLIIVGRRIIGSHVEVKETVGIGKDELVLRIIAELTGIPQVGKGRRINRIYCAIDRSQSIGLERSGQPSQIVPD